MKFLRYCNQNKHRCNVMANVEMPTQTLDALTFTNLSDGAKQPTHKEMRIQPRA